MQAILGNYLPVLIFGVISLIIACAMLGAALFCAKQKPYAEKNSPYECGFPAFEDARQLFDVRYYLVGILFTIFDLEMVFLFPWALTLSKIGMFGFFSMLAFLVVLTVGFIYEWCKGALEWD
ncbi:NADH:ubiquinone oxidoreductase subunit 3 (chain A) (NuoA) (PDB:3RKO) [Commensalibacter communis]|uniref:NADH-quinone oxidoreductase subunit A n=2 Tax=Commensalibacter TaxID=1079922 RepID=A0A9W4TNA1_9PROT|nr:MULTISPECIES: NADH-quinone oxidoreductase subunit A [Commensalibacter]MDI2113502.1 NADH-quinone oxidoreductase subunit A [Commensalibacter sp. TBRC 10068]CAI3925374.1 NADH:ubiquinone oxidoreductase subunit 3 (chain A) (NuoA) (PDB:3RKO) [Commensalibacter communis]CAI3929339.1 NADH:ubiquinone oxidoreductase subunit 3 (chain A) (NuoA) (PDB:3RKO) [Commensalibacter communis]CAI3929917.1 NADH:ubiquinone oxidoreductase subunit 3 (chain A) (NuoA) (PDB:3RKO) [Commensalibacter communis]CAI3931547.1 N